MKNQTLSAERARELFAYDPETGNLVWRVDRYRVKKGDVAGHLQPDGYRKIRIDQAPYWAHRVVWLVVHGEWPHHTLDHINGNPSDNRLQNLRDRSFRSNQENQRRAHKNSKTGVLGVYPSKGRYVASITVDWVSKRIGTFDTTEEAHQAYLGAKRELHAGCTI